MSNLEIRGAIIWLPSTTSCDMVKRHKKANIILIKSKDRLTCLAIGLRMHIGSTEYALVLLIIALLSRQYHLLTLCRSIKTHLPTSITSI